jgi:hypothetical protein
LVDAPGPPVALGKQESSAKQESMPEKRQRPIAIGRVGWADPRPTKLAVAAFSIVLVLLPIAPATMLSTVARVVTLAALAVLEALNVPLEST